MSGREPFPLYRSRDRRPRPLAYLDGSQLIYEDGRTVPFASYEALADVLADSGAVALTTDAAAEPWLSDACADTAALVLVTRQTGVGSVRLRRGRRTGWVVPAASWGVSASGQGLARVRRFLDYIGVVAAPTPSSAGQELMRWHYPRDVPKLPRPPLPSWETLHSTVIGGRVDTLVGPDKRFRWLYEYDRSMAYVAAVQRVPGGTTSGFSGALPPWAVTGYQRARITLPETLPLGPLAQKMGNNGGALYPAAQGSTWEGWYWVEELAEAQRRGVRVERFEGLCWASWCDGFRPWAAEMWRLRLEAPDAITGGLVKKAAVAAIGRFGGDMRTRRLTTEKPESGFPFCDPKTGMVAGYWVAEEDRDREGLLIQVSSYVLAQARSALFRRAEGYARQGTLVATNYDAVYTTDGQLPEETADLGAWRKRTLSHVRIPAPRWIESDEKVRAPGQRRVG